MRTRFAVFLLLLVCAVSALRAAQPVEESVDSSDATQTSAAPATSTTTTTTIITTTEPQPPGWIHLVRLAAVAGPIAFLVLAWLIGFIVHYRLVRREQEQFPAMRGTRSPQTVPMIISAALFLLPVVLFGFFEYRSRREISLSIGGVVDQWQPVTTQAWLTLLVCLLLAVAPWLLARRADTISQGS